MSEQLYTIPVNEAFEKDSECPVCAMYEELKKGAIEFVMGPSYMEDDVRMETDKIGFCAEHIALMYENQNRLGLALMLQTHMENVICEVKKRAAEPKSAGKGWFKNKKSENPIVSYLNSVNNSCYVCNRIERMFLRYLATVFYLYKKDAGFREKLVNGKGVCTKHYELLLEKAETELSKEMKDQFITDLTKNYLSNMERVAKDVEWFTDKFDYRNADQPWKNSKDAIPRAIRKMNGINVESYQKMDKNLKK